MRRIGAAALFIALACVGACSGDAAPTRSLEEFGDPIVVDSADLERWVWTAVPEMRCADDSEGGFAVNFSNRSRRLVVFLLGGGVCYDPLTCLADQPLLRGLGQQPLDFLWGPDRTGGRSGVFDRSDPQNPMRDDNFVVLPHCTGDGHTANQISHYPFLDPVHQRGYANVTEAIRRIVPTFLDAPRVVFIGFSAGGIGVTFNYHQFATAFESVGNPAPILINDSGPTLRKPFLSERAQKTVREGWGLDEKLDAWCPRCETEGLHAGIERLAELHPGLRSSILCANADAVVTGLYAILDLAPPHLEQGLLDLSDWTASYRERVAPSVQREFYYSSTRHGATVFPLSDTPGLAEFLRAQLDGEPTWESSAP